MEEGWSEFKGASVSDSLADMMGGGGVKGDHGSAEGKKGMPSHFDGAVGHTEDESSHDDGEDLDGGRKRKKIYDYSAIFPGHHSNVSFFGRWNVREKYAKRCGL